MPVTWLTKSAFIRGKAHAVYYPSWLWLITKILVPEKLCGYILSTESNNDRNVRTFGYFVAYTRKLAWTAFNQHNVDLVKYFVLCKHCLSATGRLMWIVVAIASIVLLGANLCIPFDNMTVLISNILCLLLVSRTAFVSDPPYLLNTDSSAVITFWVWNKIYGKWSC